MSSIKWVYWISIDYFIQQYYVTIKNEVIRVLVVAQWLTNPTRNHEAEGSVPALAQWVKDLHCRELWCRLQTRLGSRIAVAPA